MNTSFEMANGKGQTASKAFDLRERTAVFGEEVVTWCLGLKANHVSRPLISQLVRSATSVGANYAEASNSSSKKDYRNKVYIAKKEIQETLHWLKMLRPCFPENEAGIKNFEREADELLRILQSIINKVRMET